MKASPSMGRLARRTLDETGDLWRQAPARIKMTPHGGWLAAIREALGMSQSQLARRMGLRPSSISKLETSERGRTVRLETLARAAEALNCDLVYALVPRTPLQCLVDEQRLRIYSEVVAWTNHHMALEGQKVDDPNWRQNLLRQAEEAIDDGQLWQSAAPDP